jgi:hypothetical protein
MKRKWLRALFLAMMAVASFAGPMNPKDIEDLLHTMNETKVEFTIPDESDKDDGLPPLMNIEPVESMEPGVPESGKGSTSNS